MNKKQKRNIVLTMCIIASALLIAGLITSVSSALSKYSILVLGDSLAKGTGDETSKGFAGYYADYCAKKTTKKVALTNLGVNGDVSAGLLKIIQSSKAKAYVKNANVILISIGGNELVKLKNTDLSLTSNSLRNILDHYSNNIKEILKQIRKANAKCQIVFIGLYNPFGKSMTADKLTIINSWNNHTKRLVATDSYSFYIPTYDLFENNLSKYLAADYFHPNSAGYNVIANRIIAINTKNPK